MGPERTIACSDRKRAVNLSPWNDCLTAVKSLRYTGAPRGGRILRIFEEERTMKHTARDRRNRTRKQKIKKKLLQAAKQAKKK